MIRALIFDCFGVLIDIDTQQRNADVFAYITASKKTYKTAVLSNMSVAGLEARLPDAVTYFDVQVASDGVGVAKPDPAIFELVARKLGVQPSECVMIDDTGMHCDGARAAGMQAVLFTDGNQMKRELARLLA